MPCCLISKHSQYKEVFISTSRRLKSSYKLATYVSTEKVGQLLFTISLVKRCRSHPVQACFDYWLVLSHMLIKPQGTHSNRPMLDSYGIILDANIRSHFKNQQRRVVVVFAQQYSLQSKYCLCQPHILHLFYI